MYDWAELRHFRYLRVILEKQGFRVAAEELHRRDRCELFQAGG